MKTRQEQIVNRARMKLNNEGSFVLENASGEAVRTFRWESPSIVIVYRRDNRRVETVSSTDELVRKGIPFEVLVKTTKAALKNKPVRIGERGVLRWKDDVGTLAPEYELEADVSLEPKKVLGWSVGIQAAMALVFIIAGFFTGSNLESKPEVTVTVLPQEVVEKILEQKDHVPAVTPPNEVRRQAMKETVVAPRSSRTRNQVPLQTAQPKKGTGSKVAANKAPRGGGYKGEGPRGYGTNEPYMNQIGALSVLNSAKRVRGGNGGSGGLNLQAVGTAPGSGAGGKGFGGFGANGGGGRGKGGLGRGTGSGLANSMYGKGLIAAPFGDGSPAPGSGGYGTRGKAGGGAQGAGYGTETIVGSWKGTGPKGIGPAGSGVGNGDPFGSPWGASDGFDGEALISGGLDEEQIKQVINRNIGQIQYCYELGLQKQPHLTGRVTVRFQIGGNGRVKSAGLRASTVSSSQVENCIVSKVKNWKFPKPEGGVTVAVVYPFNLKRTVGMR